MSSMGAFFRLVRWPNLVFIILTQLLFYYCVYLPLYAVPQAHVLVWTVAASVLIAAAGYIINDYFDLNIDQINKPGKNVFAHRVNRRWAIVWHFSMSFLGILATAYAVGWSRWYLIFANSGCVILLWFYSTSFKRQLLVGNIVISLLTAWTVLILFFAFTHLGQAFMADDRSVKLFRIAFLYGGFAFVISIIREAIKDMEDLEGDARYGCKTLPIVTGIRTTKIYTMVWIVVLLAALAILQLYVLQFGWWWAVVYSVLLVIVPVVLLGRRLARATASRDFHRLSVMTKAIMFSGILSMIFFLIYF